MRALCYIRGMAATGSDRVRPLNLPVLVTGRDRHDWRNPDGGLEQLTAAEAVARARAAPPLLCHGVSVCQRLDCPPFPCFDLLELFAFARPARFCVPTPAGLARHLDLRWSGAAADVPALLPRLAAALLRRLGAAADRTAAPVARAMTAGGWVWGPLVLRALGESTGGSAADRPAPGAGLDVWRLLPEWAEHGPESPGGHEAVEPGEARHRLATLLGAGAEARPSQADYASAACAAFRPRDRQGEPSVLLAEAGTGVGKTLGYVAPASLWARRNRGAVWISTFTRNLQHQIDQELDRLYPEPAQKAARVVIRKGRENYLCLLNFEEAARAAGLLPAYATALGLMARWIAATRDGDMTGGDFPAWLVDLLGRGRTLGLADRRGECVYAACPHYHRCFIERSVRRARRAEIVVANHALVMVQAAQAGGDDRSLPTRVVFDEGHHLFHAADSAFAAHLSGLEMAELRRWLLGTESRRGGRARGLERRIADLIAGEDTAIAALGAALDAAHALPGEGWTVRLAEQQPRGAGEGFLSLVRQQVLARADRPDLPYSLQTECHPPAEGLLAAAGRLDRALERMMTPLLALRAALARRLDEEAETLDSASRSRIDAASTGLRRRAETTLAAWRSMLQSLSDGTPEAFVDWFEIERSDGRDSDCGMRRHWVDPTLPFSETLAATVHGALITSATLRDASGDVEADWRTAEARTGAAHLPAPAIRAAVASPFDYPAQTRLFVVTDVRRDDADQVAAAYRALFLAAGGGALGLFTAIQRLRAVHGRIAAALDRAGLPLHAQHVDGIGLSTLIDMFRAEERACLLGTDAVRDGVDVPGRSLRLIVFDRVPWPRPDLMHKVRRERSGGSAYTDMLTRLKLKQAFGRLIRSAGDRGVFVMLDPRMPSRLSGAFPEGVPLHRTGLAEAVKATRTFLAP